MRIGSPSITGGIVRLNDIGTGDRVGVTGTEFSGGQAINEDHVAALDGPDALNVWDKMRKSDAMVQATLLVLELLLRNGEFIVRPDDSGGRKPGEGERDWAERLRRNLSRELCCTWDGFLTHVALHYAFGFVLFERIIPAEQIDNLWLLEDLEVRMPRTILRWLPVRGGEPGVIQRGFVPDGRGGGNIDEIEIPGEKLVRFSFRTEGSNYAGTSVLRSAYKHWYMKDRLYRYDMIAAERQSVGIPKCRIPMFYSDADVSNVRRTLRNLRAHENAYVMEPDGYEFSFMQMGADQVRDIMPSIEHHDTMIGLNILATWLSLGRTSVGSRALADPQIDMFVMAGKAAGRQVGDVLFRGVSEVLTRANFGNSFPPPLMELEVRRPIGTEEAVDLLEKLAGRSLVTGDPDLENFLRSSLGMPPKPEGEEEDPTEPEPNEPPPPEPNKPGFENEPGQEPELKATPTLAEYVPASFSDEGLRRPRRGAEKFVDFVTLRESLDSTEAALLRDVDAWLGPVAESVGKIIAADPENQLESFAVPDVAKLDAIVRRHMLTSFAAGRQSVAEELKRVRRAREIDEDTIGLVDKVPDHLTDPKSASAFLRGMVRSMREFTVSRVIVAGISGGATGSAAGETGATLAGIVRLSIDSISRSPIMSEIRDRVRTAFTRGRAYEAEQIRATGAKLLAYYSAIADACDPCSDAQAITSGGMVVGSREYYRFMPQNPNCKGRNKCRCSYVYDYE